MFSVIHDTEPQSNTQLSNTNLWLPLCWVDAWNTEGGKSLFMSSRECDFNCNYHWQRAFPFAPSTLGSALIWCLPSAGRPAPWGTPPRSPGCPSGRSASSPASPPGCALPPSASRQRQSQRHATQQKTHVCLPSQMTLEMFHFLRKLCNSLIVSCLLEV